MLQREGAARTEPLARVPVVETASVMPRRSVAYTGTFELWSGANLYGFCPTWLSDLPWAAGPNELGQSPTWLVSGYSLRLNVLPNAAFPPYPANAARNPRGLPSSFRGQPRYDVLDTLDPACLAAGNCTEITEAVYVAASEGAFDSDPAWNARSYFDF